MRVTRQGGGLGLSEMGATVRATSSRRRWKGCAHVALGREVAAVERGTDDAGGADDERRVLRAHVRTDGELEGVVEVPGGDAS